MKYIILLVIATVTELIIARGYLKILKKKKIVQPLLKEGPLHNAKIGTPTMGGVSFVLNISIFAFLLLLLMNDMVEHWGLYVIFFIVFIAYAYIGFKDDILKVTKKENDSGLTPKQKLIFQFLLALIIFLTLIHFNYNLSINLFLFDWSINFSNGVLQASIYLIFILLALVGMSNATNLTDGLDGLLTSTYIVALIPLAIIGYLQSNFMIVAIIIVIIASLIGFLKFNFYPAKMFMGDTGSLSLGALIVLLSIALKVEFLVLIIGLIYIWETLSVVIQVGYFKYTKKKYGKAKRFFLMAPYHHHLEKKSMSEIKINILFIIVQIIVSSLALFLYL